MCFTTAFSATKIDCTLVRTMYAGSFKPAVHIDGLGWALIDPSVSAVEVPLTITSFTPN
jgi:hypothetical protein